MQFHEFEDEVLEAGLVAHECTPTHWQIRGGRFLVNFYPTSKGGPRIHIDKPGKDARSFRGDVADAVNAAVEKVKAKPRTADQQRYAEQIAITRPGGIDQFAVMQKRIAELESTLAGMDKAEEIKYVHVPLSEDTGMIYIIAEVIDRRCHHRILPETGAVLIRELNKRLAKDAKTVGAIDPANHGAVVNAEAIARKEKREREKIASEFGGMAERCEKLTNELMDGYTFARRMLEALEPKTTAADTLPGVLSQLSNALAGMGSHIRPNRPLNPDEPRFFKWTANNNGKSGFGVYCPTRKNPILFILPDGVNAYASFFDRDMPTGYTIDWLGNPQKMPTVHDMIWRALQGGSLSERELNLVKEVAAKMKEEGGDARG